jgi:hypothetical protein
MILRGVSIRTTGMSGDDIRARNEIKVAGATLHSRGAAAMCVSDKTLTRVKRCLIIRIYVYTYILLLSIHHSRSRWLLPPLIIHAALTSVSLRRNIRWTFFVRRNAN